ncbi:hypothetical protein TPHA_0J02360 [Tetrapisispora phaffii CBS 4417]|uniref:Ribosomal protein L7/L12 C-terminal domain-containing protein n=1 Tax=Tetrapisispora phaffii (strain ATCC 24235 / CBS 4417 / NBRC 1672 / NRRL Y-8282 / UCD 70-5) TaxID=1071381 RepID=G8BYW4_TETPH|nr:putative mitochondrial 54S ribosomal protein MNP1 TPHA_0J02360 [Tetrapisispora phaffii CBS 4417]CCE65056.1 hypothetical protein TPHA_0J02360 [Tetrapisispora phaffii CBS 4417]
MSLRLITRRSLTNTLSRATVNRVTVAPLLTRFNSTVTSAAPAEPVDPKIASIVSEISKLTLLETSSLITELKTQLNIPDIAMPVAGAAVSAGSADPTAAKAEEEEKPQEKTIFTVKLEAFDAKSKPKIIKEIKNLLGLSLVEAKKFVEAAPKVLKDNVAKEDADKIKATLEGLGAKISLE